MSGAAWLALLFLIDAPSRTNDLQDIEAGEERDGRGISTINCFSSGVAHVN